MVLGFHTFWRFQPKSFCQKDLPLFRTGRTNIQHEFGIFGGEWGNYLLSFLERIKKPVVTTLHTVQPDFEPEALRVLKEIIFRSKAIVVNGTSAAKIISQYGFPTEKIWVIQHGCPYVPFTLSDDVKPSLNLKGRTVLCTRCRPRTARTR
jgi:hypothetical protein